MADNPPNASEAPKPADAPKPPRKPRRWLKVTLIVVAALVVGLVLLVVLLPTIAGTSPVRSFVLDKVNDNLNGRVQVDDWSLGWTGGVMVEGVRVFDDQNSQILECRRLATQLSLLDAIGGNYDLGGTVVEGLDFVLRIDEAGRTNFEKLAKASPGDDKKGDAKPEQPAGELPNVSVDFVGDFRGTIEQHGRPTVFVENGKAAVKLPSINDPVQQDVSLVVRVGDGQPGTIALAGTIDAIDGNRVNLDKLAADEKLQLTNIDLAAAEPFINADPAARITLAGLANGTLQLKADGLKSAAADGTITIGNFALGGAPLKGDTFKTASVHIPVKVTRSVVDASTTLLKVESLGVRTQQATVDVQGELSEESLKHLADGVAPGRDGHVVATVHLKDLQDIANQLPHTLNLQEGLRVTGGEAWQRVNLWLSPDKAIVKSETDVRNVTGDNAGKPVRLSDVVLTADATSVPTGKADELPDLRDLGLHLTSGFATLKGGGVTLAQVNLDGSFDLAKLRSELGQFVDMGDVQLAGTGTLNVTTKGDPTKNENITAGAHVSVRNVRVAGIAGQAPLDQPWLELKTAATLVPGEGGAMKMVRDATLTLQSGQPQSPTVDLAAKVPQFDLTTNAATFELTKLNIPDLARAQSEFGAFVPTLQEQGLALRGGSLGANVTGTFDGKTIRLDKPLFVSIKSVTLEQSQPERGRTTILANENMDLLVGGEIDTTEGARGARLHTLSITTSSDMVRVAKAGDKPLVFAMLPSGGVKGSGGVTINADLPKLHALSEAMSLPAAPEPSRAGEARRGEAPAQPPPPPLRVRDGKLAMRLDANLDPQTQITTFDVPELRVSRLSLERGPGRYTFAKDIALVASASLAQPGDTIHEIRVTKLSGTLGDIAELSMPEPITVTDPAEQTKVAGAVQLAGSIEELALLLEALQGAAPGEAFPYRGRFELKEVIGTQGDTISFVGDLRTTGFEVRQGGEVAFAEDQITLINDLSVDTKAQIARIKDVTLNMQSSGALKLAATGELRDWKKQRHIPSLNAVVDYDLAKLWPVIHPMLVKPGEEDPYKNLKVTGKFSKTFNVSGSYPAVDAGGRELESFESIRSLRADGEVAVASLNWNGIDLADFNLPVALADGKATTAGSPAKFNGGTLDLAGIIADLGQKIPRLNVAKADKRLIERASINTLLGDTLGKYVNPVFVGSERAQGLLFVTANYIENLAMDADALRSEDSGRAKITFSLEDMDIANPVGSLMFGEVIGKTASAFGRGFDPSKNADVFRGRIRDAVITVDRGHTTQDITMELVDPTTLGDTIAGATEGRQVAPPRPMVLGFRGDIRLRDLKQDLNVSLPTDLVINFLAPIIPAKDLPKVLRTAFPTGVPIALRGTTISPKVDVGDIGKQVIEAQIKTGGQDLIGNLLNKDKDRRDATGSGGGGVLENLGGAGGLGGLLGGAGRDNDSDRDRDRERERGRQREKEDDDRRREEKARQEQAEQAKSQNQPPTPQADPPPAPSSHKDESTPKEKNKDKKKKEKSSKSDKDKPKKDSDDAKAEKEELPDRREEEGGKGKGDR